MAPTAKGRYNASRSNQTAHYTIMGGLGPSTNVPQMYRMRRATKRQTIPLMPIPGLAFMLKHSLLSKNPAGSGGVGLSKVLVDRSMGPCDCHAQAARSEFPQDGQVSSQGTTLLAPLSERATFIDHSQTDEHVLSVPPQHTPMFKNADTSA